MRAMKKTLIPILVVLLLLCAPFAYRTHMVGQMTQPLRQGLFDPDSAQFRNMRLVSNWQKDSSVLCGEMNARNRMGGYIGFVKFVVLTPRLYYIDDDELVQEVCTVMDGPKPWWYLGQGG